MLYVCLGMPIISRCSKHSMEFIHANIYVVGNWSLSLKIARRLYVTLHVQNQLVTNQWWLHHYPYGYVNWRKLAAHCLYSLNGSKRKPVKLSIMILMMWMKRMNNLMSKGCNLTLSQFFWWTGRTVTLIINLMQKIVTINNLRHSLPHYLFPILDNVYTVVIWSFFGRLILTTIKWNRPHLGFQIL